MFQRAYSTRVNVVASLISTLWVALLSMLFLPLYLRYIGIEAYGLIGIFTSIQAFIVLLDFGISPTLSRELSRLSGSSSSSQEMHDVKRTLEVPNWLLALSVAIALAIMAPLTANYWVQPKNLSVNTVTQALLIMALTIAVQFSTNFYSGGLVGLQKQVVLGLINVLCGTLRSVGALFVLAFISPTIQSFLLWQGMVSIIQLFLLAITLQLSLPNAEMKGRFRQELFHKVWRYAAGLTGISVVSLVLTQTDRVILSRMLDLETFGYYTFAATLAGMVLNIVINPVTHAVFPRLSQLVSQADQVELSNIYHRSCQVVSVILFPVMIVLAMFSYDVLMVWTNQTAIAENSSLLLTLAAIGTGLNGLVWLPFFLQLAYGWTRLAFFINIAAIVTLVPLMIFGVLNYGAVGGAVAWILLNAGYVLVYIQLMHRRILIGEQWRWYFNDLFWPFITALTVATVGKFLLPDGLTRIETGLLLGLISLATLLATSFSTRTTRGMIAEAIKFLRGRLVVAS